MGDPQLTEVASLAKSKSSLREVEWHPSWRILCMAYTRTTERWAWHKQQIFIPCLCKQKNIHSLFMQTNEYSFLVYCFFSSGHEDTKQAIFSFVVFYIILHTYVLCIFWRFFFFNQKQFQEIRSVNVTTGEEVLTTRYWVRVPMTSEHWTFLAQASAAGQWPTCPQQEQALVRSSAVRDRCYCCCSSVAAQLLLLLL